MPIDEKLVEDIEIRYADFSKVINNYIINVLFELIVQVLKLTIKGSTKWKRLTPSFNVKNTRLLHSQQILSLRKALASSLWTARNYTIGVHFKFSRSMFRLKCFHSSYKEWDGKKPTVQMSASTVSNTRTQVSRSWRVQRRRNELNKSAIPRHTPPRRPPKNKEWIWKCDKIIDYLSKIVLFVNSKSSDSFLNVSDTFYDDSSNIMALSLVTPHIDTEDFAQNIDKE